MANQNDKSGKVITSGDDPSSTVNLPSLKKQSESKPMSNKIMELMLQQFIPTNNDDDTEDDKKYVERPAFSIPAMSTNFRRFNARIGPVFALQNQVIQLLSWRVPSQSISLLAIYTFICLEPHTLVIIPLAIVLYFVMLPAFLARHPPPPVVPLKDLYPLSGPPLAPAAYIKPAPELSKDFFHNMRDIQNVMDDFSNGYDLLVSALAPVTNFSDERLSSTLFIVLFGSCMALFVIAHLLPWNLLFLLGGWAAILGNHPRVAALVASSTPEMSMGQVKESTNTLREFSHKDIVLDPSPTTREVEIFELQFRPLYLSISQWSPHVFSPAPYTPLAPARIAGSRPTGAKRFEDVAPPPGWRWAERKWRLDLMAREWVEERMVGGVRVEVEGERWVVDVDDRWESERSEDKGEGEWRRRRWVRLVERTGEE